MAAVTVALLTSCFLPTPGPHYHANLPTPSREFRGVWVATVANIDWPSAPGLSSNRQRAEALAILERCRSLKVNAIILQIRPQCDVFYPSDFEPWSYFLTGEQGRPPTPLYDPLQFWINEAHARGLELHAWLNPFRANHPKHFGKLSPHSITVRRPDLALPLGEEGYYWLDPGEPQARRHTMAVILEVVERYDVDGIHLDDYFYPYPSYTNGTDFPDQASWNRYLADGGSLTRSNWRRQNVNNFVRDLYQAVKRVRPSVKVGISPFGIWRPGHPSGVETGVDQYQSLYADARHWWLHGWVDYFAPQLYWRIDAPKQSFPALLAWWKSNNRNSRHLWPGLYTTKVADVKWPPSELVEQITRTRDVLGDGGHIHFSMRALRGDNTPSRNLAEILGGHVYLRPALVPSSPWIDDDPPPPPIVSPPSPLDGRIKFSWRQPAGEAPFLYVVYARNDMGWDYDIVPGTRRSHSFPASDNPQEFAVSAVDRLGNESSAFRTSTRGADLFDL